MPRKSAMLLTSYNFMPKQQTITINVTRSDIDKGVPGDSCNCAIALAAKRILPGAFGCFDVIEPEEALEVSNARIRVQLRPKLFSDNFNTKEVALVLPTRASAFVGIFDDTENFDEGAERRAKKKLKPFSFKIKVQ